MKRIILFSRFFLLALLFFSKIVYSQLPVASVNNLTGGGTVSIPLHQLQIGKISMPISVFYNGSGIKVKQAEGNAGLGWNLQAGGAIYRQLRGLPDETQKDDQGNQRLGWLSNTNGTKINAFNIVNDNNQSTCADEATDLGYINANFSDLSDTEPDVFVVSAPGLDCKLVFDADHTVRTIPYMDIKVTYDLETSVPQHYSSYGRIKSFVITTASGTKYVFAALETARKATNSSNPNAINFFKREYQQFQNGISYVAAWKLTSIKDIGGAGLDFFYTEPSFTGGTDRVALSQGTSNTTLYPFAITNWTFAINLSRVTYGGWDDVAYEQGLNFYYHNAPTSNVPLIDSITGMGKKCVFQYDFYKSNNNGNVYRSLLMNVSAGQNDLLSLGYNGLLENRNINLPDSASMAVDVWGYYNGSTETSLLPQVYINPSSSAYEHYRNIPGGNPGVFSYNIPGSVRPVSQSSMMAGTLATIYSRYTGGSTRLEYEPNDYYDATAGTVVQGGGLRIKKISSTDGTNPSGDIITNYSYVDPTTGLSSGKPVNVPLLSFTTPFYGSGTAEYMLQNSVIRLEENISQEETGVLYSHVRVSKAGIGSSLYEYLLPATNWDASWGSDWFPTLNNFGRTSCVSGGYMTNEKNTYPFAPNTNYDFERGLLKKLAQYDENGNKVRESVYNYARTGSPLVIGALRFEENAGAMAYAKYTVFSGVGNLTVQEDNTVFDAPSLSQANHTTTSYTYGSSAHKEVTAKNQVLSDGSIARTFFKYIKDYGASPSADPFVQSIYNLSQQGINIPLESYNQLERNGINRTISASLTGLKTWGFSYRPSLDLPDSQFSFLNAAGVSDFQPSSISGGVFSKDSRYINKQQILDYDKNANATTVLMNGINRKAVVTDQLNSQPVAVFENAGIGEIAYENFEFHYLETNFTYSVNPSNNSFVLQPRSGNYAFNITADNVLSRSITKLAGRKYYIFSLWMNTSVSGNINISLSGTQAVVLPYPSTGGQWKYYQVKVPVANLQANFTLSFQCSSAALIDDIIFYPADATVSSFGYDKDSFLKTSATNTNGIAEYYQYDKYLRLKNVLDQDKNIVLKKTYISKEDQDNFKAEIGGYQNPLVNYPYTFIDGSPGTTWNSAGISYTWNFGDGTGTQSTSQLFGELSHTYAAAGSYVVTFTKTLQPFGTVSATQTVVVGNSTDPVKVYGAGSMTLTFSQNSVIKYVFNAADLATGMSTVEPGVYDLKLAASGQYSSSNPSGYKAVGYHAYSTPNTGLVEDCRASMPTSNQYYFNGLNLTGKYSISFYLDTNATCIPNEIE